MNQPKRHHYVPEMLLNRFTDDEDWLYCCWRGGAKTRFWKALPKNAFVERHLYTKRDGSGNRDTSVEADLGDIESATSPVIDKIVSCALEGDCPRLTAGEREILVRLIIHQHRRIPENLPLVKESLDLRMTEIPDAFAKATGRPATTEELAEIKDPEFRELQSQNAFASFAGVPPVPKVLQFYTRCLIQFGVIRIARKNFVIGSRIGPADWFPVHRQVALRLVAGNGPDGLTEFQDMTEVRRINEQTVKDSLALAGPSQQLVRSLAGPS